MINIYDYKDAERLRIYATDSKIYEGSLVSLNDAEDEDEDFGLKEDSLTIAIGNRPITFPISEIEKVETV